MTLAMPPDDWVSWFSGLHAASHRASARRLSDDLRLARARAFIDAHFDEAIDLDLIARSAHMSRYHFLRQFRRAFGLTPHQYLTRRRILRARALLQDTELSITEICFEVGFQSLGSFSTLFRRHVGHAPSRYRARRFHVLWQPPRTTIPFCFFSAFSVQRPLEDGSDLLAQELGACEDLVAP